MFDIENFYWFLSVSLLINLAPGPDMVYTLARSLSQGTKGGVYSALGVFSGGLFHISAAVFGLSEIIEESVLLFSMIKYAGAAYLVYLGLRSLLSRVPATGAEPVVAMSNRKIFYQAVVTNVLNPKVAIFFLSFLPQFIDPASAHLKEQIALLGLWFNIQGTLVLLLVAMLAGLFRKAILGNTQFRKWQEKITGLILLGLGVRMLFSKKLAN